MSLNAEEYIKDEREDELEFRVLAMVQRVGNHWGRKSKRRY